MPVDKKILGGGLAMLCVGIVFLIYFNTALPVWERGMTEEQSAQVVIKQREFRDYSNLAGMLAGIGFLLVLISFGAKRKKGGAKAIEKKPPA